MTADLREALTFLLHSVHAVVTAAVKPGRFVVKVDIAPVCFIDGTDRPPVNRFFAALWFRCGPRCTWGDDDRPPCTSDHRWAFFAHGDTPAQTIENFKSRFITFMEDDHATQKDGADQRGDAAGGEATTTGG